MRLSIGPEGYLRHVPAPRQSDGRRLTARETVPSAKLMPHSREIADCPSRAVSSSIPYSRAGWWRIEAVSGADQWRRPDPRGRCAALLAAIERLHLIGASDSAARCRWACADDTGTCGEVCRFAAGPRQSDRFPIVARASEDFRPPSLSLLQTTQGASRTQICPGANCAVCANSLSCSGNGEDWHDWQQSNPTTADAGSRAGAYREWMGSFTAATAPPCN
jgi:hypothetical protein